MRTVTAEKLKCLRKRGKLYTKLGPTNHMTSKLHFRLVLAHEQFKLFIKISSYFGTVT